jgi:hypothetical protein
MNLPLIYPTPVDDVNKIIVYLINDKITLYNLTRTSRSFFEYILHPVTVNYFLSKFKLKNCINGSKFIRNLLLEYCKNIYSPNELCLRLLRHNEISLVNKVITCSYKNSWIKNDGLIKSDRKRLGCDLECHCAPYFGLCRYLGIHPISPHDEYDEYEDIKSYCVENGYVDELDFLLIYHPSSEKQFYEISRKYISVMTLDMFKFCANRCLDLFYHPDVFLRGEFLNYLRDNCSKPDKFRIYICLRAFITDTPTELLAWVCTTYPSVYNEKQLFLCLLKGQCVNFENLVNYLYFKEHMKLNLSLNCCKLDNKNKLAYINQTHPNFSWWNTVVTDYFDYLIEKSYFDDAKQLAPLFSFINLDNLLNISCILRKHKNCTRTANTINDQLIVMIDDFIDSRSITEHFKKISTSSQKKQLLAHKKLNHKYTTFNHKHRSINSKNSNMKIKQKQHKYFHDRR